MNEVEGNKKYLNKVVEVTGEVVAIGSNNHQYYIIQKLTDRGGINCVMMVKDTTRLSKMKKNVEAVIKACCIGFLADVNLADFVLSK